MATLRWLRPTARVLATLLVTTVLSWTPTAATAEAGIVRASAPAGAGGRGPAGFVALSDVDHTILQDIRYDTYHNFVGRPIVGYRDPICILTRQAAEGLHRAQVAAQSLGYSLKVYDCFRPQRAVDDFVRWAERLDDQRMKAEFYPRVDKTVLFADGYIASRSGHSRGSTVDLTLVALPPRPQRPYLRGEPLVSCFAPRWQRFGDNTVDMGTGFDCFDPLANTLDPRITGRAMDNRLLLKQVMTDAGFTNYASEWWHYTLAGEPYPDTYFDFPVARRAVTGG
ncbi:M15 family metallopeptidase [Planosporangium mesophilum]|uniref:D-alanyl-D-alanine dipeptidase n=1 Tax=Planosporangium mesophilum TaxID=689768 RepID=A0A8J3TEN0_9ACTN|nr:M15 family metallopeptidase [Planosporangium mesophilum]NJC82758.1 M15 family metallopeptidase [Planosporangium mesophilum]GII23772.1 D-alanyl-D-alanine dipeptidase [Planosporangium mesophilum]